MNCKFTMIILFVLGTFFVSTTTAQTVVTGIITDGNTGETLPGVTVKIDETSIGVSSDSNGKYTISIPFSNTKLVFTSIGYQAQTITVNGRTIINVQLVYNASSLNEVVVTALGVTREKRSLGYAIAEFYKCESEERQVFYTNGEYIFNELRCHAELEQRL